MKKVGCYLRVSTRESAENGWSIAGQYDECRNWIDKNRPDWQVVKRYTDAGFSASSLDRPALVKMLDDIDRGRVDCIALWRYDRLSREMLHFQYLLHHFKTAGVEVISISEPAAIDDPTGEFVINLMALIAQLEKRVTQVRVKSSMMQMARQGKFHGGPTPFGYSYDKETQMLVINEAEAGVVKEMFRLYLQKGSIPLVTKELAKRGILTRSQTQFNTGYIRAVLRRRRYVGEMFYAGYGWEDPDIRIISDEQFNKVNETLTANRWQR